MSDWIPLVAQIKSVVQIATGDEDGARQTQENFVKRCPVVSQTLSAYQLFNGNMNGAKETQLEFLGMINDTVNSIPLVGHAKGVVHYIAGDKDGGDDAMKSASHTAGTISGGIVGFGLLGPVGAVAGGIAGGAAMDVTITTADSLVHDEDRPYGYVSQIKQIKEKPEDGGQWVDMATSLAFDGITGHAAGVAFNQQTTKKSAKGKKPKHKGKKAKTGKSGPKSDYKVPKNTDSKAKVSNSANQKINNLPSQVIKKSGGDVSGKTKVSSKVSVQQSVTSAIADITESTTEAAAAVGQVIATTKGILDNSITGDLLLHAVRGNESDSPRDGKDKTSCENGNTAKTNLQFPIPKEAKLMNISRLQRGDHVKYKRLFGYSHHAIVTDVYPDTNEYEVIHFSPAKNGNKMLETPFIKTEVKKVDEIVYVLDYEEEHRNPREATATMAETILEYPEQDIITVYSVFSNNCEHLATYCATGKSYSVQVENGKELLKALAKTGMVAVSAISKRQKEKNEKG